jgi:hypothetical protein
MNKRDERFQVHEDDITVMKRSGSGTILTPEVIDRARARVAAGEDLDQVAFDLATEEVHMRGKIDNNA